MAHPLGFDRRLGPAAQRASIRPTLDEDDIAGLNLYSRRRAAFDQCAQDIAMLLATHAGVIMARQLPLQEAADLEIGLASSREIGLAMGVLMHTDKITETTRSTCSASPASAATANCELATEVTDTDTLEAT